MNKRMAAAVVSLCGMFLAYEASAQYAKPGWFVVEKSDEDWEKLSETAEKQVAKTARETSVPGEADEFSDNNGLLTETNGEILTNGTPYENMELLARGNSDRHKSAKRPAMNDEFSRANGTHNIDSEWQEQLDGQLKGLEKQNDMRRFAINNQDLRLTSAWLKREMKKSGGRNFVVSPLSFYLVSVLLANGLVDESLWEFSGIFPVMRLSEITKKLKEYMDTTKKNTQINNSIWGNAFNEHYRKLMKQELNAEAWSLPGNTMPINNWVAEKTGGKLKNVVPVEETSETDLFLVNTIYFNNKWRQRFDARNTQAKEFFDLDGPKSEVLMMSGIKKVDYYEDEIMQAVRLYYVTDDYMTIFLPRESVDFRKFAANLDGHKLNPVFEHNVKVNIKFPKFDIMYNVPVPTAFYEDLGIKRIFDLSYNYAKMISFNEQARVKKIILLARITVDETEADAATKAVETTLLETVTPEAEPKAFIANRPFVFMVNNGDFVGAFTKGKVLTAAKKEKMTKETVGEVAVKERKNGETSWYEDKNQRGDLVLKNSLKNKPLKTELKMEPALF